MIKNVSPTITPTRVIPTTEPSPEKSPRYAPDPDHCPSQRVRTVRRIRRTLNP